MAMNIDLKPGETQKLVLPTGEAIELTLQKKSGRCLWLELEAAG